MRHAVLGGYAAAVPGEAREVRGARVEPAHATGGKDRGVRVNLDLLAVRPRGHDAATHARATALKALEDVRHAGVLEDARMGQVAHAGKQVRGDLLPRDVLVVDDARAGVCPLARVVQLPVRPAGEANAALDQVVDDGAARADHDVHALQAVLVVARAQRVLKEGLVVARVVQDADAALGEHGVTVVHGLLGEQDHRERLREVERAVETSHAAADDDHVAVDHARGARPVRHERTVLLARHATSPARACA